ncbi:unnamed protein product, partial [Allacma fusca]
MDNQRRMEKTVKNSNAVLAKRIQENTEALLKRVEKVEQDQSRIRQDFANHIQEVKKALDDANHNSTQ